MLTLEQLRRIDELTFSDNLYRQEWDEQLQTWLVDTEVNYV